MKREDLKCIALSLNRHFDTCPEKQVCFIPTEIMNDTNLQQQYYDVVKLALNEYEKDISKNSYSEVQYEATILYYANGGNKYEIVWKQDELLKFKKIEDVNERLRFAASKLLLMDGSPHIKLFDVLSGYNDSLRLKKSL